MKMENRAVTVPQTRTTLHGVNVPNVQLDNILAIINMKNVWKFLISTVHEPATMDYFCKLNAYIARNEALERRKLRAGSVGISRTHYVLPVPKYETIKIELDQIINEEVSATEKALDVFT